MSSIGWRGSKIYCEEKLHGASARRSCDVVIRPARPEGKKKQEYWWCTSKTRSE